MSKFIYGLLAISLIVLLGNKCATSKTITNKGTVEASKPNVIIGIGIENLDYAPTISYIPDSLSEITINLVGDLMLCVI